MLKIENIQELKGTMMADWNVKHADDSGPTRWLNSEHYCITFQRGNENAAVLITRGMGDLSKQYHVFICYDDFTNIIYSVTLSKETIGKKDSFFGLVINKINEEYYNRSKVKK